MVAIVDGYNFFQSLRVLGYVPVTELPAEGVPLGFSFSSAAEALSAKTGKEVSKSLVWYRYHTALAPGLVIGNWTAAEDKAVIGGMALGRSPAAIASELPGRSELLVRARCVSFFFLSSFFFSSSSSLTFSLLKKKLFD